MRASTRAAVAAVAFALLLGAGGTASAETVAGGTAAAPTGTGTGVAVANATVDGASNSTLTVGYRVGPDVDLHHVELRVYGPRHHRYYDLDDRSGTVDVTLRAGALAGGVHRYRAAVVNASPVGDPALATDVATVEAASPVALVSTGLDAASAGASGNVTLTATLHNPTDADAPYDLALYERGSAGGVFHWNEHDPALGAQAVRRVVVPAGGTRTYELDGSVRAARNGSGLGVNDAPAWRLVDGSAEPAIDRSTPNRSDGGCRSDGGDQSDHASGDAPAVGGAGGAGSGSTGVGARVDRSADYETVATADGATLAVGVDSGAAAADRTNATGPPPTEPANATGPADAARRADGSPRTGGNATGAPGDAPSPNATADATNATADAATTRAPADADGGSTATTAPGFSAVAALVALAGAAFLARRGRKR